MLSTVRESTSTLMGTSMRESGLMIKRMGREPIPTSLPQRSMMDNGWMERNMDLDVTTMHMATNIRDNGRMEKNSN